ncbi:uncharacterized protein TRIADDRAFT_59612 [Trichoplax adhaerens]|uniref:VWFA domain-containing protein n=1 Tax=Trichoplax adhaerens TaxID=10228 RepID=B3S5H0_TRIAD|nr:hypothetical protein TRIADDRAFT_59612 [Trichoplax adhaerens]EDV21912.1 hypothetical protein TRIADDRAFT_59612 [Trichoplax adhaerens]|eukprot:XP_002115549.1 hypothetical protein TRIADDRAFT_59612 [Trichoplax adhaerens]
MILIFVLDTSASMNQQSYLGTSYLDITKGAVEYFLKLRSRDPACRTDKCMLITTDDPPAMIKVGWRESHYSFLNELKNLQATGYSQMDLALREAFNLLNVNRMVSGIDKYGQGRDPHSIEPAVIITLTDGCKLTSAQGIANELIIPLSQLSGDELTKEPFRWDQRLFSIVIQFPGIILDGYDKVVNQSAIVNGDSHYNSICEATGGKSYLVASQKALHQSIESIIQKLHSGVVVNFEIMENPEDIPDDANSREYVQVINTEDSTLINKSWHKCRRIIYVNTIPNASGHWPIPEPYTSENDVQPRFAHPTIKFSCIDREAMMIDRLPFDKYELEPSPLTQYILERKSPNICWQTFIAGSDRGRSADLPFGYLKASNKMNCVNLHVLPYNYPVLLPLLDDLFRVHRCKPDMLWKEKFGRYVLNMPSYYGSSLKRVMLLMGAPIGIVPEHFDGTLNFSLSNMLKKLRTQAKVEADRMICSVGKKPNREQYVNKLQRSKVAASIWPNNYMGIIESKQRLSIGEMFRNPYDIPRFHLLEQLKRMIANFFNSSLPANGSEEYLHDIPISQMGNYQEHMKRVSSQMLREVATGQQPQRVHIFGNPFKRDQDFVVDEADVMISGQSPRNKRPGTPTPRHSPKRMRLDSQGHKGSSSQRHKSGDVSTLNSNKDENKPSSLSTRRLSLIEESDDMEITIGSPSSDNSMDSEASGTSEDESMTLEDRFTTLWQNHDHNKSLKKSIVSYIRNHSKTDKEIFKLLEKVKGTEDDQVIFLKTLLYEVNFLRKNSITTQLRKKLESINME